MRRDVGLATVDVTAGFAGVAPPSGGAFADGSFAAAPYIRVGGVRNEWGLGVEWMRYTTETPSDVRWPNAPSAHQYFAVDVTPNLHASLNPSSFLSVSLGAAFVRVRVDAGDRRARAGGGAVFGARARWPLAPESPLSVVALVRQSLVSIDIERFDGSAAGPSFFVVGLSYEASLPHATP